MIHLNVLVMYNVRREEVREESLNILHLTLFTWGVLKESTGVKGSHGMLRKVNDSQVKGSSIGE